MGGSDPGLEWKRMSEYGGNGVMGTLSHVWTRDGVFVVARYEMFR